MTSSNENNGAGGGAPAPPTTPSMSDRPELDDRPPILGSWRNIYAVVIGTLIALIVAFTIVTKVYAP